jgi:hypothetical protein
LAENHGAQSGAINSQGIAIYGIDLKETMMDSVEMALGASSDAGSRLWGNRGRTNSDHSKVRYRFYFNKIKFGMNARNISP